MIWGGINLNGRTELVVIREGSMTARRYTDEVLDNVRPHVARVVQHFLNTHNIQVMDLLSRPQCNRTRLTSRTLGQRLK
jgi:hypothetical protein